MHFLVFFLRVLPAPFLTPEPYFTALSWRKSSSVYLQCSPCQALISLELISLRTPAGTGTGNLPGNLVRTRLWLGFSRDESWNGENKSQAAGSSDLIPKRSHLSSLCYGKCFALLLTTTLCPSTAHSRHSCPLPQGKPSLDTVCSQAQLPVWKLRVNCTCSLPKKRFKA